MLNSVLLLYTILHLTYFQTRVLFYSLCVFAEDLETQQKGAVLVLVPGEKESINTLNFSEKLGATHSIGNCMPLRVSAYHVCLNSSSIFEALFMRMALMIVPKNIRSRCRVHKGSPLEWQYSLSSFGINAELLPFTSGGSLKPKPHHKWIKLRKDKEEATKKGIPFDGIECPNVQDVFFRRGGNVTCRYENLIPKEIFESKHALYRSRETQEEKTKFLGGSFVK